MRHVQTGLVIAALALGAWMVVVVLIAILVNTLGAIGAGLTFILLLVIASVAAVIDWHTDKRGS